MTTAPPKTRKLSPAPADVGSWWPPDYWQGSDLCSGVKNYVFGRSCRRHDWRWRYSMARIAGLLSNLGIVGLILLAVVSMFGMLASNVFYLVEQYGDLVRSRHWWNPLLWLFPIWRTGAVTITGVVWFNCMGDGR